MTNDKLNINIFRKSELKNKYIIFLHGFTGSSKDWQYTVHYLSKEFNCVGIDLPGHGKSPYPDDPEFYDYKNQNKLLKEAIDSVTQNKIILVGYSMGGRAALHFAKAFPERIEKLILESTSPGIKVKKDKELRISQDQKLASFIQGVSIRDFVTFWLNTPLFATQQKLDREILSKIKTEKRTNRRKGLVNSILGFGTGIMPHLWNDLKKFNFPVLLLTGKLDTKFTEINKKMLPLLLNGKHKIIENCGHNIHLENVESFTDEINRFLNN